MTTYQSVKREKYCESLKDRRSVVAILGHRFVLC